MALRFVVTDKAVTDTQMLRISVDVFDDAVPTTILLSRDFDFTLDSTKTQILSLIKTVLAPMKDQLTGLAKVQVGDGAAL